MIGKSEEVLLVSGGFIGNPNRIRPFLPPSAFVVGVDHGADSLNALGLIPDLLIGDKDSSLEDWDQWNCEKVLLSTRKDQTDTEAAVQWIYKKKYRKLLLIGGTGNRLDHTLGNLSVMTGAFLKGMDVKMEGGHGGVRWISEKYPLILPRRENAGISLVPVTGSVKGVTTKGLLYPLQSETLDARAARGVSNEWTDDVASITVSSGILLAIIYEKEEPLLLE